MKVAVFSDVQANYPSLVAAVDHILDWSPDLVIMNGDLVNRGPRSLDCLELFKELQARHGWIAVRGNHEEFVMRYANDPEYPGTPLESQMQKFTEWTYAQLGNSARVLDTWADEFRFSPPGVEECPVSVMHGSLMGNRVSISESTPPEELAQRVPGGLSVFVTAHTHRPLLRQYGACEIVNSGSVGSPFDSDRRASYARLVFRNGQWENRIVRFDYDYQQADRDYHDSGFLGEAGPIARLIYEEWRRASGMIDSWRGRYLEAVRQGQISLQEAVDQFISDLD